MAFCDAFLLPASPYLTFLTSSTSVSFLGSGTEVSTTGSGALAGGNDAVAGGGLGVRLLKKHSVIVVIDF